MPKRKQVQTLKTICLRRIGSLITNATPRIAIKLQTHTNSKTITLHLQKIIDQFTDLLLSYIAHTIYEEMADEIQDAINNLIKQTKKNHYPHLSQSDWIFFSEMNVAQSLPEIILTSRLISLDFSQWMKGTHRVLFKNLYKLTNLQHLDIGSTITTRKLDSVTHTNILNGLKQMKRLKSFTLRYCCDDIILKLISENCRFIESIDISKSSQINDDSITYLILCNKLKRLRIIGTHISKASVAKLIFGLPFLIDIGPCNNFAFIPKYLSEPDNFIMIKKWLPVQIASRREFDIKRVEIDNFDMKQLNHINKLFPKLEFISLRSTVPGIDLSNLKSFQYLKKLKLLNFEFFEHKIFELLECHGANLTSLILENMRQLPHEFLVYIGKYCVNLKNLVLYDCKMQEADRMEPLSRHSRSFKNLINIFWGVKDNIGLEYVLFNAINLKILDVSPMTNVTHASIVKILENNPLSNLEELRILYSIDMGMHTVELLLENCLNLRVLTGLEWWAGITRIDLNLFKSRIVAENLDLDIRPKEEDIQLF